MNFENLVDMMRLPFFSNCCWASITSSKLLSIDDFSSIGGSGKGVYESNRGMNIVKIVDKMVENLTQGR